MQKIESALRRSSELIERMQQIRLEIYSALDEMKRAEEERPRAAAPGPKVAPEVRVVAAPEASLVEVRPMGGVHTIPLINIVPAPWRYSRPKPEEESKLRAMISRRGQLAPIHVRPRSALAMTEAQSLDQQWEIVDGHRIYDCLRGLGAREAWCLAHPEMTVLEAQVLALELNETRGELDHVKLAAIFSELVETLGAAEVASHVGLDQDQVKSYADLINFDWRRYASADAEQVQQEMWE